ncbi:MBL fold metallo-hydrolase [Chitinophaga sp. CC14]|uniref:MBL fold metallo-hydrolase n=1 Tax=Chitinophaga TaxID=79328 RepID=UPI000DB9E4C4|nr:MBL fold metallo-hydrolase [Chitinophaga ginsengisegetis]MDR6565630.1 ribonuclease Z [Chitinophaga ginsengisegetis]MDR6645359.1 ribonuclease Z [Chitinophaga ginsengisegetis]MDR6652050.1 ribonuclease Z [Chitinophaga ginsengisegetis]
MKLTISGYSTALFSTWYFLEELGILMDAGDGLTAALLQKSRKINYVFISHADRDHLTGLLQLNQLNARAGLPVICYPRDSSSFPAMEEFSKRFDPHIAGTQWRAVAPGDEIWVKDDIVVIPVRNEHVTTGEHIIRSLSYKVMQVKQKVKPELAALPPETIRQIIMDQGKESTTMEVRTNLVGYSGDTPVQDLERWDGSDILIHEATFLASEGDMKIVAHKNKHSKLEEVMDMVSRIRVKQLILGHFSSRYSAELIDRSIKQLCDKYGISIPVFRLLPGLTVRDILSGTPVNK